MNDLERDSLYAKVFATPDGRKVLADMQPVDAMELLINRLQKVKTNAEFLMSMNIGD